VAQRIAAGQLPPPPGYGDGYTVLYQRAILTADSRTAENRTGVRGEIRGETAFEPGGESRRWISYGGSLAASVDLTGKHRVLGLGVDVDFVDPLDDKTVVPFVEQVIFGGEAQMRGFPIGRLVDRSGASATLLYTWPVWAFLDGSLFASVGDVFDEHLTGLRLGELRLSGGMGMRSNGSTDNLFELLVGFGTDTFDAGAAVTSIRVVIGVHHGF